MNNTTTTNEPWNFNYKKPSFFTPARTVALTVLFLVVSGIIITLIVNCVRTYKDKKLKKKLIEIEFYEENELDEVFY